MSYELFEKFCLATFPDDLTFLDLHLLEHYCLRFNTTVTPARAFPGMPELMRITNAQARSILRSRARLVAKGYLYKISRGNSGTRSEFGVNEDLIRKLIEVTEESPNPELCPEGDESMTSEIETGDPEVSIGSPVGHPISKERNKSEEIKIFDLGRFEEIIEGLPGHLRAQVSPNNHCEELLDRLERAGNSHGAIRAQLSASNWKAVTGPGGITMALLRQSLAAKSAPLSPPRPSSADDVTEPHKKLPIHEKF